MVWLRTLGALTGLAAGGVIGEAWAEARDRRRFPAPGEHLVGTADRRLHLVARGEGGPVVVIDGSLGAWSSHYRLLATELARTTRVVTYDRAGLGWSDEDPGPCTLDARVADLQRIIDHVAEGAPVLLVGHGLGALIARALVARDVVACAGLVVVDGFPADFLGRMTLPEPAPGSSREPDLLHVTGVARVAGHLRGVDDADAVHALGLQRRVRRAAARERELSMSRTMAECFLRPVSIPLRVVHSAMPLGRRAADDYSLHWYRANEALVEGADDAMAYVVRDCDHWIPVHRPDAVASPVRDLIALVRRARTE